MRFLPTASFSSLFAALLLAGALVLAGCDSGGSGDEDDLGTGTTFSFATGEGGTVAENAGDTYEMTIVVDDPGFKTLSVNVVFDEDASGVDFDEISGIAPTTTVEFPESTTDSTTRTLSFTVEDDDEIGEMGEDVVFRLQNPQGGSLGANTSYTITVNDDDLEAIDLSEARRTALGEMIAVEGIVTRVEGSNVRIQDGNVGLVVRSSDLAEAIGDGDVSTGDRIRALGTLGAFNGLLQLSGDVRYMVVGENVGTPAPQTVEVTDVQAPNGEEYESELVRIEGLGFASDVAGGTFSGGTNYTVGNAMGDSLSLRIPSGSFYAGENIPGGTFTFEGVVGQFSGSDDATVNEGYQLLAIDEGDLTDIEQVGPNIMTIADARDMGVDANVTVEGVFTRIEGINARIEDGTAGIVVRDGDLADAIESGDVEQGDRIRASGGLGEFNGLLQISEGVSYELAEEDAGLPTPQDLDLSDIGEDDESELVTVDGFSFVADDATFSSDGGDGFGNYAITGEDGNESDVVVRIPSGSFYDGEPIPSGPVTFTGVIGERNGTYKLVAIDEGDLGAAGDGGGGNGTITIAEARQVEDGTEVTIEGIVTSAGADEGRVQDGTAGIYISRNEDFGGGVERGDRVRINGIVNSYANQRQIDSDNLLNYEVLSSGNALPAATELADLSELGEDDESERVRVEGVTIQADGDATFQAGGSAGNYTITDGSGNERILRIPGGSFYEGEPIPSGEVTIEAVAGQFSFDDPSSGYQILARYDGEIAGGDDGGGGGDAQVILSEDFQDGPDDEDGELGQFTAISVDGDGTTWAPGTGGSAPNLPYAIANNFSGNQPANDWLISPALNLDDFENEQLSFLNAKGYDDEGFDDPTLQVLVSNNYDGSGNPENFDWTDITDRAMLATTDDQTDSPFSPFIDSGTIDLSDFDGSAVYVAFKYISSGTGAGGSEAQEIDNVLIQEAGAEGGFPTPPDRPSDRP